MELKCSVNKACKYKLKLYVFYKVLIKISIYWLNVKTYNDGNLVILKFIWFNYRIFILFFVHKHRHLVKVVSMKKNTVSYTFAVLYNLHFFFDRSWNSNYVFLTHKSWRLVGIIPNLMQRN